MTKVWIITRGDYSDYHIVGIFSSRETADALVAEGAALEGDTVEGWELDPVSPDDARKHFPAWIVRMDRQGKVIEVAPNYIQDFQEELRGSWDHPVYLTTSMLARDERHAIKFANERRAQLIACGSWDRVVAERQLARQRAEEYAKAHPDRRGFLRSVGDIAATFGSAPIDVPLIHVE